MDYESLRLLQTGAISRRTKTSAETGREKGGLLAKVRAGQQLDGTGTAGQRLEIKQPWYPPTEDHPLFDGLFEKILQQDRSVDYLVRYPGPSEQDWEEERDAVLYYRWKAANSQQDITPKYSV